MRNKNRTVWVTVSNVQIRNILTKKKFKINKEPLFHLKRLSHECVIKMDILHKEFHLYVFRHLNKCYNLQGPAKKTIPSIVAWYLLVTSLCDLWFVCPCRFQSHFLPTEKKKIEFANSFIKEHSHMA